MIDTAHGLLDGTRATVSNDVWDIERRIKDGDPGIGWPGDPSMGLFIDTEEYVGGIINLQYMWFEVWGLDASGEPYLAWTGPQLDQRVIEQLRDGHWTNGNAADRVIKSNLDRQAAKAKVEKDRREETLDKLHFALRQGAGAHYGGLTKRFY